MNNYWKELNDRGQYYSVGKEGYQVSILRENGRMIIQKPWKRNAALSAELKLKMKKVRIVAEASKDQQQFQTLWRRIDHNDWDKILNDNSLRLGALVTWLMTTPTQQESDNNFRYG